MMEVQQLLDELRYTDSPYYLTGQALSRHPGYAHVFRQARKSCSLQGVYALRHIQERHDEPDRVIPVVYVCQAGSEPDASEVHRLAWNQNVSPFILVSTPRSFCLYGGFNYENGPADRPLIEVLRGASDILGQLRDFTADAIDQGHIWRAQASRITAQTRVDRKLLHSLKALSDRLVAADGTLDRAIAHTLIGKYVYLSYLRHRKILSDERFAEAGVQADDVLGTNPTLRALYEIEEYLNGWLNGGVFPLPKKGISREHVRLVARTFRGYEPQTDQMHLDFAAFDFVHIPVETLSAVYQQFLHAGGKGREKGAFYTPSHLVNLMLDELEAKKALVEGTTVFDAACGSAAFLVQCYRRMIERELVRNPSQGIRPTRLREILTKHIFGLEVDEDACNVAELSLILTLLDYVDPPDLTKSNGFKLPVLRDANIFHCENGFFDEDSKWAKSKPNHGYGLVVGNPPWKQLNPRKLTTRADRLACKWIERHKEVYPVDRYQMAEAFIWKTSEVLAPDGQAGLVMPASTLFTKQADKFRTQLFAKVDTWCAVNLANVRRYLFEGAINPAICLFFGSRDQQVHESIPIYSPFAVEQIITRGTNGRVRKNEDIWQLVVNECVIRDLDIRDIATGSRLPWKLAMWGTPRDRRLLRQVSGRFPSLGTFAEDHQLMASEGLQLPKRGVTADTLRKDYDPTPEVVGKKRLLMKSLRSLKYIHRFQDKNFTTVDSSIAFVRRRGGKLPLTICKPPHVIVDAARRFAVFTNEYIVVPPRQIGIAGDDSEKDVLKALATYLKSDFAKYHQFLVSSLWGVERDRANLDDLEELPVPIDALPSKRFTEFVELHDSLAQAPVSDRNERQGRLFERRAPFCDVETLTMRLNDLVYDVLGVSKNDQWLIEDLLNTRAILNDGNVANEAVRSSTPEEMKLYAGVLKKQLDDFLNDRTHLKKHMVTVHYSEDSAIVEVRNTNQCSDEPKIVPLTSDVERSASLVRERLSTRYGQWMYFQRGLRIFSGRTTYLFKPRERLYWLRSQALTDADEIIAAKLSEFGGSQ
jgi:hypothetical protein